MYFPVTSVLWGWKSGIDVFVAYFLSSNRSFVSIFRRASTQIREQVQPWNGRSISRDRDARTVGGFPNEAQAKKLDNTLILRFRNLRSEVFICEFGYADPEFVSDVLHERNSALIRRCAEFQTMIQGL